MPVLQNGRGVLPFTKITCVGFLASVGISMAYHFIRSSKLLLANITFVVLLSSVGPSMCVHVATSAKCPRADIALEGLLVRVFLEVTGVLIIAGEPPIAKATRIWSLTPANMKLFSVGLQSAICLEGVSTELTLKGLQVVASILL